MAHVAPRLGLKLGLSTRDELINLVRQFLSQSLTQSEAKVFFRPRENLQGAPWVPKCTQSAKPSARKVPNQVHAKCQKCTQNAKSARKVPKVHAKCQKWTLSAKVHAKCQKCTQDAKWSRKLTNNQKRKSSLDHAGSFIHYQRTLHHVGTHKFNTWTHPWTTWRHPRSSCSS